jgi:hypothetical protein
MPIPNSHLLQVVPTHNHKQNTSGVLTLTPVESENK